MKFKKFGKLLIQSALNIVRGGFSVSPRILDHLGISAYDSIRKSLVELASNSYDADSTEVRISLPKQINSKSELIIEDNGIGMSTAEFQENYLKIGRNRRMESDVTPNKGRKVIGNKGIGKLAGFGIAGLIRVETYKDSVMTAANLRRDDFNKNKDLESTKFDIETYKLKNKHITGTKIILKELREDLSVPDETFLRRFLRNNLPKYQDFKIFVNEVECTIEDIIGEKHEFEESIQELNQKIKGYYIIATSNQADPGFSIRVRGRLVTKPSFFELPLDSFTGYIGKKFTGELYADFLDEGDGAFQSLINTSRDGFIEDNETVKKFNKWIKSFLKKILKEESQKKITGQTNKILQSEKIESRLSSLPSVVRSKAREVISALVSKMKEQSEQDIIEFASLILQYFESNVLKELLDRIIKADSNDIKKLADMISEWGVRDVAGVTGLVRQNIQIIKKLEELVDSDVVEMEIHKLFEKNLWLIDDQYKLWLSNKSIKKILDGKLSNQFKNQEDLKPDLVCLTSSSEAVVIEFKRPRIIISLKDLTQALEYKSIIQKEAPNISSVTTFVIGKKYDESIRAIKDDQKKSGNFLMSYAEVLSKAEMKFSDILSILEGKNSL